DDGYQSNPRSGGTGGNRRGFPLTPGNRSGWSPNGLIILSDSEDDGYQSNPRSGGTGGNRSPCSNQASCFNWETLPTSPAYQPVHNAVVSADADRDSGSGGTGGSRLACLDQASRSNWETLPTSQSYQPVHSAVVPANADRTDQPGCSENESPATVRWDGESEGDAAIQFLSTHPPLSLETKKVNGISAVSFRRFASSNLQRRVPAKAGFDLGRVDRRGPRHVIQICRTDAAIDHFDLAERIFRTGQRQTVVECGQKRRGAEHGRAGGLLLRPGGEDNCQGGGATGAGHVAKLPVRPACAVAANLPLPLTYDLTKEAGEIDLSPARSGEIETLMTSNKWNRSRQLLLCPISRLPHPALKPPVIHRFYQK
ncbi:MAG: hypothetical protein BJ554DRAFT_3259, partial [Olpidium bornovanus]